MAKSRDCDSVQNSQLLKKRGQKREKEEKKAEAEWNRGPRVCYIVVVVVVDRFYIALFSAFEQSYCARM